MIYIDIKKGESDASGDAGTLAKEIATAIHGTYNFFKKDYEKAYFKAMILDFVTNEQSGAYAFMTTKQASEAAEALGYEEDEENEQEENVKIEGVMKS